VGALYPIALRASHNSEQTPNSSNVVLLIMVVSISSFFNSSIIGSLDLVLSNDFFLVYF